MADMETHAEIAEDPFKASNKTTTLNGHPDSPAEDYDEESNCSDKVENGKSEYKSPQLNGDIDDESDFGDTDINCGLPNSDNICVDENASESISNEGIAPENGDTPTKSDYLPDSEVKSFDNLSDVSISNNESIVSEEQVDKSYLCTKANESEPEEIKSCKDISDQSKDTSDNESAIVDSDSNLIEPSAGEEGKDTSGDIKEESHDKSGFVAGEDCSDKRGDVDEKSNDRRDSGEESNDNIGDNIEESEDKVGDEGSGATSESVEDEPNELDSDLKVTQDAQDATMENNDDNGDKKGEETDKVLSKKKDDIKRNIVKRVTRSSSGVTKPVKYADTDSKNISDDDDDIKITKEVKKDEESDIEMIEESDPLAISDADVKKAKEANKTGQPVQDRLKNLKPKESPVKVKDESNVIIIDTNTLLKGQNSITPVPPAKPAGSVSTSAQTTGCGNTASNNIQTAIQAITGGNPAIQGLQSAYLNAIQQVLVAQGGSQVSNPHYIATLQQYYNTLGALQDDAYVIEAPSFIVPYVMEGKPIECIKDYLVKINKELEELEKKKKEEEEEALKKKKEEEEAASVANEKENNEETAGKEDKDVENQQLEIEMEGKNVEDEATTKEVSDGKKSPSQEESAEEVKSLPAGECPMEAVTTLPRDDDDKDDKKEPSKIKEEEDDIIPLDGDFERPKGDFSHLGRWESYYRSALGKFFVELGLNHVQEFIQSDLLRMQKRRVEKKTSPTKEDIYSLKMLERQVTFSKQKNAHLYMPMKTCRFCSFKTESGLVMERHLESPHMVNYTYKCNFCEFETRGPQVILFHTEAEHNVRGRLERAPAFFQCPLCPFEDNNKSKKTRHSLSCAKKFKADKNSDLPDWEPPAKIPKIHRGRPNTFGKTFDALKMPNLLPKNFSGLSLNLHNAISSGLLGPTGPVASTGINSVAGRGRGRPVGSYKNITQPIGGRSGSVMYPNRGTNLLQPLQGVSSAQLSIANQVLQSVTQGAASRVPRILPASSAGSLIPGLAASSSITIQSVQSKSGASKSPQQPSISITPLPRGGSSQSGNKTTPTNVSNNSQRPAFVICEICDGYIKDLEQLRNHMNLIHKVKIHPKMIYNRPPLNCQKCQHRFFTDQGLERHLLGTHGLVTSSMQEAANKGKDAGRCPICGKVFQWKLLNHVSRDHKMTLKPAHLSYKCTVCTATFNMYRLFENHVYSAHSVVNKNKGNEANSNASSAPPKKSAAGTETPLKINDEITIIPQPASKSPKSESKVSPKKTESPSMSKEITITKVGSRSSSRRTGSSVGLGNNNNSGTNGSSSGGPGGVEVISLDDSPHKRQVASVSADEPPPKKRTRDTATSKRARTST